MSLITVNVLTAELVNPSANEDKFYRTYELPADVFGGVLMQNGSQRTGRTGGQFRLPSGGSSTARSEMQRKLKSGYNRVAEYQFQIDETRLRKASDFKNLGKLLDGVRGSSAAGKEDSPSFSWNNPSTARDDNDFGEINPAPVGGDSIEALTNRVQAAITLAVTDPTAAMVEMSDLREQMELTAERTLKMRSFFDTLELLVADAVMGR